MKFSFVCFKNSSLIYIPSLCVIVFTLCFIGLGQKTLLYQKPAPNIKSRRLKAVVISGTAANIKLLNRSLLSPISLRPINDLASGQTTQKHRFNIQFSHQNLSCQNIQTSIGKNTTSYIKNSNFRLKLLRI